MNTGDTPIQDLLGAFIATVGTALAVFSTPFGQLVGAGLIIAGIVTIRGDF